MKKVLTRIGLAATTLGVVVAGASAFSAFEAHIINVTARIENALSVQTTPLNFGTVFPQEYLVKSLNIGVSQSFDGETRVDDVEYVIKQKPKVKNPTCAESTATNDPCNDNPNPGDPYAVITVGEFTGPAWQYCEENLPADSDTQDGIGYTVDLQNPYWHYCYLPLANSLSKHENTPDGEAGENDISVDAFHQAYTWNNGVSSLDPQFYASGQLVKSVGDVLDTWLIDLKVPCFVNMCAQEAYNPENGVDDAIPGFHVPAAFQLDPKVEHKVFGTDLWVEVTGISIAAPQPQ